MRVAAAREHWGAAKDKGFDATYWQPDEQRALGEEGVKWAAYGLTRPMDDRPLADMAGNLLAGQACRMPSC